LRRPAVGFSIFDVRRGTAVILAVVMMAAIPLSTAEAATMTADYGFQNTFASSVGGSPNLVVAGTTEGGGFASDLVGVTSRTVYRFPQGQGLALQNASAAIPSSAYTVAIVFAFDVVDGYRRILDFKDGTSDSGLYVLGGQLTFYSGSNSQQPSVPADTYVQVVLTRDANGLVTGYTNGVPQFSFSDTGNLAVPDPTSNVLRFFLDDNSVGGEQAPGGVARIRIWDEAMTESEVANLDDTPPPPPPPDPRCEDDPNAECGTDGDDDMQGTSGADVIFGGDGNDTIHSGDGDDQIFGDAGDDEIDTGAGNDSADGGSGNDRIFARAGNDLVKGGAGDDLIKMAGGLDKVFGGPGKDRIDGGPGFDLIDGGKGFDVCFFSSKKEKRKMKSCEKKKRAH